MAILDDVNALIDRETTMTGSSAKVARMSYTETAYTNGDSDNTQTRELAINGVANYDKTAEQNIPVGTPSAIGLNESVVDKGIRTGATIVKQNSFNHFWGRVSYNLNKAHDWFKLFLTSFKNALGAANGIATLDGNGRIPYSQLPESAMEYMGSWDASTNTPHLEDADSDNVNGQFYIVSVGGTQTFDGQSITFKKNDRIICKGTGVESVWQKLGEGDVIDVKQNGISLVDDDGVANLIPYYSYIIDSQAKFDDWINNVTTDGQDYTSVAIIGGKGSGVNGEYLYSGSSITTLYIPDITKEIKGFLQAKIDLSNCIISTRSSSSIKRIDTIDITTNRTGSCIGVANNVDITISNSTITSIGYGIGLYGSAAVARINNCNINTNGANANSQGIHIQQGKAFVSNSKITDRSTAGNCIYVEGGEEIYISNCILDATYKPVQNAMSAIISIVNSYIISTNFCAIEVSTSAKVSISNSTITALGSNASAIENYGKLNISNSRINLSAANAYGIKNNTNGFVNATGITFNISQNTSFPTYNCGLNQPANANATDYKSGGMDRIDDKVKSSASDSGTSIGGNGLTGQGVNFTDNYLITLTKPWTNYGRIVIVVGNGTQNINARLEIPTDWAYKVYQASPSCAIANVPCSWGSSDAIAWFSFSNSTTIKCNLVGTGTHNVVGVWGY